jgi:DNA (cytosine-5)-methyltransferase 1
MAIKYIADLFCGAGGTSTGAVRACAAMGVEFELLAINHWRTAVRTHELNHPTVRHLCCDLDNVNPNRAFPGALDLLAGSPECTHHSVARGGRPCSEQSRASAWHVLHWADKKQPKAVLVENVREFRDWGPLNARGRPLKSRKGELFLNFLQSLAALGYGVEWRLLNAADYGDATTRTRLFILARKGTAPVAWPEPSHHRKGEGGMAQWRAAREIIDWSLPGRSISDRKRPLAPNTMKRIRAGLRKFGGEAFLVVLRGTQEYQLTASAADLDDPLSAVTTCNHHWLCEPFLVKFYGTGISKSVTDPLDTVTSKDRFLLVEPQSNSDVRLPGFERGLDIRTRMLQPHELAAAMGFPKGYLFYGNRTAQVKQIGNAVAVNLATALCRVQLS